MPRWQTASGVSPAISCSLKRMDPAVGVTAPETQLKHVVLPEPLGPMSPRISPAFTSNETPLSAVKSPKRLVSRLTVSTENGRGSEPPPREMSDQRAAQGDDAGSTTGGFGEAMT